MLSWLFAIDAIRLTQTFVTASGSNQSAWLMPSGGESAFANS